MQCHDVEKVKPLDELLDEKIDEFESGADRACDRDLDAMIWEHGDFENEEPPQEAEEFEEEPPREEELVEKKVVIRARGQASLKDVGRADEAVSAGVKVAAARSLGRETRKKR